MSKYHRLGGLNNRYLFITVLKDGKSKIKVSRDLVSVENTFLDLQMATFLLYPHSRDTNHRRTPPSWLTYFAKPPSLISYSGLSLQHMNFGGNTIQFTAYIKQMIIKISGIWFRTKISIDYKGLLHNDRST